MDEVIAAALVAVVTLSGVPLMAIALGAGTASLLSACFQVQEASVIHLVRLAVFAVILLCLGQVAYGEVEALFIRAMELLARSGDA